MFTEKSSSAAAQNVEEKVPRLAVDVQTPWAGRWREGFSGPPKSSWDTKPATGEVDLGALSPGPQPSPQPEAFRLPSP